MGFESRNKMPEQVSALVDGCYIFGADGAADSWEMTIDQYGRLHIDHDKGHLMLPALNRKELVALATMFRKAAQVTSEYSPAMAGE